jgi:hypothetical protein
MDLDARVKRQEPGLGDSWNLRSVLHIENDKPCPHSIVVGEVSRLGFQVGKNRLDRLGQGPVSNGRIRRLNGH